MILLVKNKISNIYWLATDNRVKLKQSSKHTLLFYFPII